MRRAQRWFERHQVVTDALIAGPLLLVAFYVVGTEDTAGGVTGAVLTFALVAPLPWRRSAPAAVFTLVMLACLAQVVLVDELLAADFAALIAVYTLIGYGPSRTLGVAGVGVALVGSLLAALRWTDPLELLPLLAVCAALGAHVLLAALLGERRRNRQRRLDSLIERNRLLAIERDQQADLAAAAERARIARELHDVVAHSLSVIVTQADGGRYAASQDLRAAAGVLDTIAATGREALTEMRRLLGVLRVGDGETARLVPQPGAEEVETLVEQIGATGLPVQLCVAGRPRPLPAGVDVTVYRVAQEALTNVLRHAGSPRRVEVELSYVDDGVELAVRDDGRGDTGNGAGGHGVSGMRERVELHGGALLAGPKACGGYEVDVHVPTPTAAA